MGSTSASGAWKLNSENTDLLDLAGIGGAADQNDLPRHVERDHRAGPGPVACRIGLEAGQMEDRDVRAIGELIGPDQEVADEQRVPGRFGEDAHRASGAPDRRRRAGAGHAAACPPWPRACRRAAAQNARAPSAWLLSHQTSSAVSASRTMNLSLTERPVKMPVVTASAPPSARRPSPPASASSTSVGVPSSNASADAALFILAAIASWMVSVMARPRSLTKARKGPEYGDC